MGNVLDDDFYVTNDNVKTYLRKKKRCSRICAIVLGLLYFIICIGGYKIEIIEAPVVLAINIIFIGLISIVKAYYNFQKYEKVKKTLLIYDEKLFKEIKNDFSKSIWKSRYMILFGSILAAVTVYLMKVFMVRENFEYYPILEIDKRVYFVATIILILASMIIIYWGTEVEKYSVFVEHENRIEESFNKFKNTVNR